MELVGVVEIYQRCKFNTSKGNKLKQELIKLGYVLSLSIKISSGRGGKTTILILIDKAWEAIGYQKPKMFGKGGEYHKKFVSQIAHYLRIKKYNPLIEYNLQGKQIDVVFEKDNQLIGIELEMSELSIPHAVTNYQKDTEVGVNHVIFITPTLKLKKQLAKKILSEVQNPPKKISFMTLGEFITQQEI